MFAFNLWQIGEIGVGLGGMHVEGVLKIPLTMAVIGGSVWFVFEIFTWWIVARSICRNKEAVIALNDERIKGLRFKALAFGFFVLVGVIALFRAWAQIQPTLPVTFVLQSCMVAAVSGAIGWYLKAENSVVACS